MEQRIPKTISLPLNLWGKIDEKKGDVSRSRYISKLLVDGLSKLEKQNQ